MFETIKKDWQDGKIISIEDVMFFSEQETLKRFEWLKKIDLEFYGKVEDCTNCGKKIRLVNKRNGFCLDCTIDQAKTMNIEKLDSFSKSCEEIKDIMRELNGIKN